jgi:hypothetical protein
MGHEKENRYRLLLLDETESTTVNAGANGDISLQPPDGYIYEVISFKWSIPGIAASAGNHNVYIYIDLTRSFAIATAQNVGTNNIVYNYDNWETAASETPSQVREQFKLPEHIIASNDYPVLFRYANGTDTNQTGSRILILLIRVFREATT